ncbi:hypothetical protein UPYG_G00072310 [Umbra pygmaea]|uniref:SPRY-associated domain-containing protein n=1 Tax=Umbra pygmaea TaxID=75934 RepID=A0ABD0XBV4_UMBPY
MEEVSKMSLLKKSDSNIGNDSDNEAIGALQETSSSFVSLRNDNSKKWPIDFRVDRNLTAKPRTQPQRSDPTFHTGQSQKHQVDLDSIFSLVEENVLILVKNELKRLKGILQNAYQEGHQKQPRSARNSVLNITLHVMRHMKQTDLADMLEKNERNLECQKYYRSEEGLLRLLLVVKASRKALLNQCHITERYCGLLASAINSNPCNLRDLDLSSNDLKDTGVKLLSVGLRSPYCRLEKLRLSQCNFTGQCCEELAPVISSHSSCLKVLDLSYNDLHDSGVKQLSLGLGNPCCKLESLSLSFCRVTEKGCASLALALKTNPSHLKNLDLSYNYPGISGVRWISAALKYPSSSLEKLNVDHGARYRIIPGPIKYACELTFNPNTAFKRLVLSEGNKTVTRTKEDQPYPDHPDRFDYWDQVLCRQELSGCSYWEVQWTE